MNPGFRRLPNFRDAGGLRTADGRTVRRGVLYRSGAPDRMTKADVSHLRALGTRLVCDLRAPGEHDARVSRWLAGGAPRVVNIPLHEQESRETRRELRGILFSNDGDARLHVYSSAYYRHVAFTQAPRIGEAIRLLADEAHLPVLVHCSAGKDRTGILVAVVLWLLGVGLEDVLAEYLRTNDFYRGAIDRMVRIVRPLTLFRVKEARIRLVLGTHARFLRELHERICGEHGSVEGYARQACGLDSATLAALARCLLAPPV